MRQTAISIISMLIGFYVIESLASLFLIHGASNNKRLFLVPWMLERSVQLLFYTVLILSIGLYFFTSSQTIGYSLVTIIFGGLSLGKWHSNENWDEPLNNSNLIFQSSTFIASCASSRCSH
jgi:Domain of unknown function (DUF4728)